MSMRTYKCHKEVQAAKITEIWPTLPGPTLILGDEDVIVCSFWMDKHQPKVGGYYVEYSDGYESYSPAEAFEDGYTKVDVPK